MNRVLLDKGCQFLNGRNNDMGFHVLQLLFQNHSGCIAVRRPLFKTVIFLHGLVVQILTVYHKQHLINIWQLGSKPRCLKRSQGLAGTCGVPDITAAFHAAIFFIIVGNLNPVKDTLRSCDLIRTHDHQHILGRKDTIFCQDI